MKYETEIFSEIKQVVSANKNTFKNKTVYCNCKNPINSELLRYFKTNFKILGLKKLIVAGGCENDDARKVTIELLPSGILKTRYSVLTGTGKFLSHEGVGLLNDADIVITITSFITLNKKIQMIKRYEKLYIIIENSFEGSMEKHCNIP